MTTQVETQEIAVDKHYLDPNSPESRASTRGEKVDHVPGHEHGEDGGDGRGAPGPGGGDTAARRDTAAASPQESDEPKSPPERVDPRHAIALRSRERRAAASPEQLETPNVAPEAIPEGVPVEGSAHAPAAQTEQQHTQQAAAETPDSLLLKVNGRSFMLTREEALASAGLSAEEAQGLPDSALKTLAQKNIAAEMRLQQAKQADKVAAAPEHHGEPTPREATPPTIATKTDQELVELTQIGEAEEALAAHRELNRRMNAQNQARQTVQTVGVNFDKSAEAFAARNPDLVKDEFIGGAVYSATVREVIDDLRQAFPELIDDNGALMLQRDPGRAMEAYKAAIAEGHKLRSPDEIFQSVETKAKSRFGARDGEAGGQKVENQPAPSRQDLKRGMMQQPTRATPQSIGHDGAAPRTQDRQSRRDVFLSMKRARHQ